MNPPEKRLAIVISGRGSNMQAFIEAQQQGQLSGHIGLVVSNRPNAHGLVTANEAGINTAVVDHTQFETRQDFDDALADQLDSARPDLIILAGFMRILTSRFVEHFAGQLMNIHPSLLPKYPGLHTHQRALDAGDAEAGATVHYVTNELDGGPPILQGRVPVLAGDTAAKLAERVLPLEHAMYTVAANWHLGGRLQLMGQHAYLDGVQLPQQGADWSDVA